MSGVSPSSVLFSSDGYELAVVNGSVVPTGTRALLISGSDPFGNSRYTPASIYGALGTTETSNSYVVTSGATITGSGSQLITGNFFGTQEIALVVNVGTVTGGGSISYTIQEVDPGDGVTVYGNSATTGTINSGNTPAVFTAVLNSTTSSAVRVSWTVTPAFSATIYATVTTKSTPLTQAVSGTVNVGTVSGTVTVTGTVAVTQSTSPWVVSGTVTANQGTPNSLANAWPVTITDGYGQIQGSAVNPIYVTGNITATNPSVGANNAASLGFDTQVGGIVSTAAPTYTNGNLSALSLTTLGGLRIDGVYATGTATGTAADAIVSGGYVTTAAPTYTTGQLNALSLDTNGSLRVTEKRAASSTVTAVNAVSNSSYTALAANANRLGAFIFNNTGKTLNIKLGATASTTSFTTVLFNQAYWESPAEYTGIIDVFSPTGTAGTVLVTEITP